MMKMQKAIKIINATGGKLLADDPVAASHRDIWYAGKGWYSLDDTGVYIKGEKPTTSRIKFV